MGKYLDIFRIASSKLTLHSIFNKGFSQHKTPTTSKVSKPRELRNTAKAMLQTNKKAHTTNNFYSAANRRSAEFPIGKYGKNRKYEGLLNHNFPYSSKKRSHSSRKIRGAKNRSQSRKNKSKSKFPKKEVNYEVTKSHEASKGVVQAFGICTTQGIVRNYNEDRVSVILNVTRDQQQERNRASVGKNK